MHELIDFLAQTEVIIILAVLGLALSIYFILWFRSFLKTHENKKKLRNNTMELTNLAKDVKLELAKRRIDVKKEEPSIITEVEKEIVTPKKIDNKEEKVTPVKKEVIESRNEVVVKEVFTSPIESVPVETVVINNNDKTAVDDMVLSKMYDTPVEVLDVKDDIIYKEEVYTKEEAKEELDRLTMELTKEEINEPLQVEMKEEVVDTNIDLTPFEDDQEENAIISLEELLKKGKVITQDEIIKYEDEGDEPISISELEARYKKEKELEQEVIPMVVTPTAPVQNMTLQDFNEVKVATYKEDKSYNPTPVISPIFGIEEGNIAKEDALELENTANFDKLDEEIRKTNEFLSKIRELQKKLD